MQRAFGDLDGVDRAADMDPQIEVRITVKTKADGDLSLANSVLDKIKAGWKL